MRLKIASLLVLSAALLPAVAKATPVSPISFGGSNPLLAIEDDGGVIYASLPGGFYLDGRTSPINQDLLTNFTVTVAAGYRITDVYIGFGPYDDGLGSGPSNQTGYQVGIKLTLCDAYGCHSSTDSRSGGSYPFGALSYTGTTSSGQGTYELVERVRKADFLSEGPTVVIISYEATTDPPPGLPTSVTPEPGSLMLTGTGLAGLMGVFRSRRKK